MTMTVPGKDGAAGGLAGDDAGDRLGRLADGAAAGLRELAGRGPDAAWAAPGRVNLIGEHTDYNDGYVLPVAIDRHTVVAAARRGDGRLRCRSLQEDDALDVHLDDVAPDTVRGWGAYVAGAAWALLRDGVRLDGADVVVNGDVPLGAGLSSSAALACATTGALAALAGATPPPREIARIARRAEIEIVGMPCGVMDQLASTLGRAGDAVFIDTRTLEVAHIPFDPGSSGLALVVIDTRAPHRLVEGAYAERRASCEAAAAALGVGALRDADLEMVEAFEAAGRLEPLLARRARHVVTENARVLDAAGLLRSGGLDRLGGVLGASHTSLRDDYEVSCPELDVAVEAAVGAGAVGARMTGAGFGGSAIALVPAGVVAGMEAAVAAAYADHGFRPPRVFRVGVGDGAAAIA
jgi:galactokinase